METPRIANRNTAKPIDSFATDRWQPDCLNLPDAMFGRHDPEFLNSHRSSRLKIQSLGDRIAKACPALTGSNQ
jgi:hypothetical protein